MEPEAGRPTLLNRARRGHRLLGVFEVGAVALVALYLADRAILHLSDPAPPLVEIDRAIEVVRAGSSVGAGRSQRLSAGEVPVFVLRGPPAQRGYELALLASDDLTRLDEHMFSLFESLVPFSPARLVLERLARIRYRGVAARLPDEVADEIAGLSTGYGDRFSGRYPTYPRQVFYHAVYDVALSFEKSPLIGCTAFAASGAATRDGHTWVGRNFDFEAGEIFDRGKCVTIVVPDGGIPFASVAWPGMLGAVTGLNAEGIWASVNGARSGASSTDGVPLIVALRLVLEHADDLAQAIRILERSPPMVSHIVLLADGETGEIAIVERDPAHFEVRRAGEIEGGAIAWAANHFHAPALADTEANRRVVEATSTLAREARMREVVKANAGRIDEENGVAMLRDRALAGGDGLPAGDRRAIDAQIATHSVLADATSRRLYVAEGPHTKGTYRPIDLRELVSEVAGVTGGRPSK